jgi:hypothetical protein
LLDQIRVATVSDALANETGPLPLCTAVGAYEAGVVHFNEARIAGVSSEDCAGALPVTTAIRHCAGTVGVHQVGIASPTTVDEHEAEPLALRAADSGRLASAEHIHQAPIAAAAPIVEEVAQSFSGCATGKRRRGLNDKA